MPPPEYKNACWVVVPVKYDQPTTCPAPLMPRATLSVPPSVPRPVIVPPEYKNACTAPLVVDAKPTTCPALLMPLAKLERPPSVPRLAIVAPDDTEAPSTQRT